MIYRENKGKPSCATRCAGSEAHANTSSPDKKGVLHVLHIKHFSSVLLNNIAQREAPSCTVPVWGIMSSNCTLMICRH